MPFRAEHYSLRYASLPWYVSLTFLAMQLITAMLQVTPARAAGNPLNGSTARPFYIFGHNPNTVTDAEIALSQGANALEPDVTLATCGAADFVGNLVDWDSSSPNRGGRCSDTKLTQWLAGVHDLAFRFPVALIVFDVKSPAATGDGGLAILQAVRSRLNFGGIDINVIVSVASRKDGAVFDYLIGPAAKTQLGPREGVQIDEEDDAGAVANYFFERGYKGNIGFGDGTAGPGPHLFTAVDGAAWARAAVGYPRLVTYVYTIGLESSLEAFIDAGVDGIIPTDIPRLARVVKGRSDIFLAARLDNPFRPRNEAYGLTVRTETDRCAVFDIGCDYGTDANITFTIKGELGTARITVDTSHDGRMEEGSTNYVTIPSKNLGALESIQVTNDGRGNGPDWRLQDITINSAHWFKPDASYNYTATLNDWVRGNSSITLPLTPGFPPPRAMADEYVWGETHWAFSDGSGAAPWNRIADAYNAVLLGGTIHAASGAYVEKLTLNKPCTLTFWSDHGTTLAAIGGGAGSK